MTTLRRTCGFLLGLAFVITTDAQVCKDLDATACTLLHNAKPDLCNDTSLANTCRRFCGLCPIECYDCQSPVRDPSACVQSSSCSANETCMLKEYVAVDGHHEYIMSCVAKTICSLFSNGFASNILGKRGELELKQKRDISVKCCDTDNCNKPLVQTTPTTPPPPPSTPKPFTTHRPITHMTAHVTPPPTGSSCQKDLAIAVDSSGSVGSTNFQKVLDFLSHLMTKFTIGPHNTQVALETFASAPENKWLLNTYSNQQQIQAAIRKIQYHSGGTRTDLALQFIMKNVLHSHGDRRHVPNVVLLITDGNSNQPTLTAQAAQQLHHQSTNVIAVGVGNGIGRKELSTIASNANHVIALTDFHSLQSVINKVHALVCS